MLFEFLLGSLFQPQKTLGTDNVFHLAGISLRCPGINPNGDKLFCKKRVNHKFYGMRMKATEK